MRDIGKFQGKYRFLSNFYPSIVTYDGEKYNSVEHAYQAAKTSSKEWRIRIANSSPGQAKRVARLCPLRKDWELVKEQIMLELLRQKFQLGTELGEMLLETKDAFLIEGNTWHDNIWSFVFCTIRSYTIPYWFPPSVLWIF